VNVFANPLGVYLLGVFPLLLLAGLYARVKSRRKMAAWGGDTLVRRYSRLPAREWDTLRSAALWAALALTLLAFARPQWGEVAENVHRLGLDVVVLLDTSRSMGVNDVEPTRLERSRMEIRSFLEADRGDRVGLVAFAGVPVALSPLTEDTGAISMLLDIADEKLIPIQGSDLGKGIAKALSLFDWNRETDRVILLFSDGEDMASDAVTAAGMAMRRRVKIFCVGVGTPAGGVVTGVSGSVVNDPDTGSPARSMLHEETLRRVSETTDGRYWRLSRSGSVAPRFLEEFKRLKRKEYASSSVARRQEQYKWFLFPAVFLLLAALLIPGRRRTEKPLTSAENGGSKGPAPIASAVLAIFLLGAAFPAVVRAASPRGLAGRAMKAFENGKPEAAFDYYRKALALAPGDELAPLLHFNAGTCALFLHRNDEAVKELTLAASTRDAALKSEALLNLAHAYQAEGRRNEALAALKTILIEAPGDRRAALLYEWILRQKPPKKPPPKKPPKNPPPENNPPDVLKQLPMPLPKELQKQIPKPVKTPPGMKPW